jgi:DNA gyrase subunit B
MALTGEDGATAGNGGGRTLSGPRLTRFVQRLERIRQSLEKLASRGYPEDVLKTALALGLTGKESRSDRELLARLAAALEETGYADVEVLHDEEHGTGAIRFVHRRDGVDRPVHLGWDLVANAEYRSMAESPEGMEAIRAAGFSLTNGGSMSVHETLEETLDTLYAGARKGLSIQRYKGLGEMNPTQLWETTMDPERRRLMQVRVDDEVEAETMFTTLMGDLVEPRREFIETHALDVKNLDV